MLAPTQVVLAAVDPTNLLVGVLILIVLAPLAWVFRGRCPKCKRFFAFSR